MFKYKSSATTKGAAFFTIIGLICLIIGITCDLKGLTIFSYCAGGFALVIFLLYLFIDQVDTKDPKFGMSRAKQEQAKRMVDEFYRDKPSTTSKEALAKEREIFNTAAARFKSVLAIWLKLHLELTTSITMGHVGDISLEKIDDFETCAKYLAQNFEWAEKNKQRMGLSHLEEIKEWLSQTQVILNVYKEKR